MEKFNIEDYINCKPGDEYEKKLYELKITPKDGFISIIIDEEQFNQILDLYNSMPDFLKAALKKE